MKHRPIKQYDDDDGRVIAPMNVDGMPWYDRNAFVDKSKEPQDEQKPEDDELVYKNLSPAEKKEYRKETNAIIRGVIRQFMPFLLLFVGTGAIVILIMWLIWK